MKGQEGSSGLGLWLRTSSRLEGSCSWRPGFGMFPPPWTLCQGCSCAQGSHPHKPARVVVLIPQFTDEETGAQRGKTTCPKSLNKNCWSKGHHMGTQESTCPRARAPYMRGPGATIYHVHVVCSTGGSAIPFQKRGVLTLKISIRSQDQYQITGGGFFWTLRAHPAHLLPTQEMAWLRSAAFRGEGRRGAGTEL